MNQFIGRQIEHVISYYENIISELPCYVYWKDQNFIYLGCNELTAQLLHLPSRNAIVGKTDYDFGWKKEIVDSYRVVDERIVSTGKAVLNIEETVITNEKTIHLLVNKRPLLNEANEIIGILGISIDITERKKMEEDLRKGQEAEAAKFLITEFVSNMGHDLATPLSDVGGIAQMLNFHADEYPELKELFDMLIARFEACEEVRRTILNATSIANLNVKLETFSIAKILLELETALRPAINSKNLKLIIHPLKPRKEDQIKTDRTKFHSILFELISNAINFTEKGQIIVSVSKKDNFFHIKVADTGIGIPSDKFDYIFQQYTKLARSNQYGASFKGVGAGLYLARIRANILSATISVESEVDNGSIFILSIPAHSV